MAQDVVLPLDGEVVEGGESVTVRTALAGDYNASNLLGVLAGLRALGLPLANIAAVLPQLTPVPGRLQPVGVAGGALPAVLVDYPHTPHALQQVLQAVRPMADARGGRLWCVFGCGGNRDASKRPLMGAIAERGADRVLVTSDNPRLEAPEAIIDAIVAGLERPSEATVVVDRRSAIATAVRGAGDQDVVLLAGKGHEDYQDVAGMKHPFSDADEALHVLLARQPAAAAREQRP